MKKSMHLVWRIGVVGVVALALALVMSVRLARLQLSAEATGENEKEVRREVETTTVTLTTPAMRGVLTDRYGRELVSNVVTSNVQLEYALWDRKNQNAVIAELAEVCTAAGAALRADAVPLAADRPAFLESWLDPETRSTYFTSFLKKQGWSEALSAEELWEKLRDYYGIGEETDYAVARTVAGVRSNMERYDFAYANPFVFCYDVGRELVLELGGKDWLMRGVRTVYDYTRVFETTYAAHILGRVGSIYAEEYEALAAQGYRLNDTIGKDGAEAAFEKYLRGSEGSIRVRLDGDGRVVEVVSETEAKAGNNVMLTLDLELQKAAEDALASQIGVLVARGEEDPENYPTDVGGGAVVVIDVNSGEILAMASYPTFDISRYSENYNQMLADPLLPMFNRALSGIYSPGSVFKVVTSVACLQEGVIEPDTVIEDLGVYRFYDDYQPECWIYRSSGVTHGEETVAAALRDSCNYFFYEAGRLLNIDRLGRYATAFGLGEYTGIELYGETKGYIASPESKYAAVRTAWVGGDTLQAAIGQSYNMFTPLQICNCIATLANGGTRYEAHILKYVTESDYSAVVNATQSVIAERIDMSETTHSTVMKGMSEVTENGTAAAVFSDYEVHIGGKTGSVQVPDGSSNSVFVAFGPYDAPEIAVAVIVEHGGSGNGIAPIALEIFKTYFSLQQEYGSGAAEQTVSD